MLMEMTTGRSPEGVLTWGMNRGVARGAGGCGRLCSHGLAKAGEHEEVELVSILLLVPC